MVSSLLCRLLLGAFTILADALHDAGTDDGIRVSGLSSMHTSSTMYATCFQQVVQER